VGDFYGTAIEIWAGFGPNGQLSCLHSFKIFWARTPYSSRISATVTPYVFYAYRQWYNGFGWVATIA
jgi:hypothetical protein